MIQETYFQLINNYDCNEATRKELWMEIEENYSSSNRYYHTLTHLETLLNQLHKIRKELTNWEAILFSVYYHDLIYDSTKSDNEEQSAFVAAERMRGIKVPELVIEECQLHILATKFHNLSENIDTNYFTDADLSILGYPWKEYSMYFKNVRKEYMIYSDEIFNEGRSKVLKHFLNMARIYKTDYFYSHLEQQAKVNLSKELDELNGISKD